jgi:hypothetical protein
VRPPRPGSLPRARRHAGRRYSLYFRSEHFPARLPDLPYVHEPEEPGWVALERENFPMPEVSEPARSRCTGSTNWTCTSRGRARRIVKRPRPHQAINAALIGHLRSLAQPVALNEVRQPQLRHTDADVKR